MTEIDEILVQIIATADTVFLPLRAHQWDTKAPANRYLAQRDFAKAGLPFHSSQSTAADRAESSRLLGIAQQRGLLNVHRPRGSKWPHTRLTDTGEALARALIGLPSLAESTKFLRELSQHEGPEGWVSEFVLAGPNADAKKLMAIEDRALPALWRELCEVNSDIRGQARYRLTQAGRDTIGKKSTRGQTGPPPDPQAREIYYVGIRTALDALETAESPESREIGELPLSCSME